MNRIGHYEILITAPDGRFVDKSFGVCMDSDSAMEEVFHYEKLGFKVKVYDQDKKRFIIND